MTAHPDDMQQIVVPIRGQGTTQSLTQSSQKPSAAKMEKAIAAYRTLMRGRPDYGKESPDYAVGLTETLSHLTEEELAWVTNPREGLATVCKFLPTPADVHEFIRAKRAKLDEFKPAHTNYARLNDKPGPWDKETDFERKKRVVMECLGYNPEQRGSVAEKRTFTKPTEETVRNLKLKTPSAPASPHLIKLLHEQGWPFIPDSVPENKTETGVGQ